MSGARLPRARRAETPPPMQLTSRDLEILRTVAEFRYMTREQVEKLFFSPASASYCKRRLSLLYHNGYLERRFLPLRQAFGAARAYYTLDRKGADVLAHALELPRSQLDWRPRDGRREALYMEHSLRINDVRVLMLIAAKAAGLQFDWIDERELKRRASGHRVPDPLHQDRTITIVPDGYFKLAGRWAFALELDRGTVEEVPFKRKVRGYGEWKASGRYAQAFGIQSLRVLFVVADAHRDPKRLARIQRWTEDAKGRSLFWYAHLSELSTAAVLAEPVWSVAGTEPKARLLGGPHDSLGLSRKLNIRR